MKNLGTILMFAGIVAFITPRLNYNLPEGVSIPTLLAIGTIQLARTRSVCKARSSSRSFTGSRLFASRIRFATGTGADQPFSRESFVAKVSGEPNGRPLGTDLAGSINGTRRSPVSDLA